MKKIVHCPAQSFKTYDDENRFSEIREIVKNDEFNFLKNNTYKEFYDFVHKNHEFHKQVHYLRYMYTAGVLFSQINDFRNLNILEVGGYSPLSQFLALKNNCFHTESDLRVEIDAPTDHFDIVICCEVIEHIKDQNPNNLDELVLFTGNGVKTFAKEVNRVVKKDGVLILTTPNANSLWSIIRSIRYEDPYIFRGHVREYTKNELCNLFSTFEPIFYKSYYNFRMIKQESRQPIVEKFKKIGWDLKERGDNHVLLLKKR